MARVTIKIVSDLLPVTTPPKGWFGVENYYYFDPSGEKYLFLAPEVYELQLREPFHDAELLWLYLADEGRNIWLYKNKVVSVRGWEGIPKAELQLLIKHKVLREEKLLQKIRKELQAFENFERIELPPIGWTVFDPK